MTHTLEVHLWGFQGQTVDYSAGIWGSNVLSKSSFQGRLPHDNRNYKDVIPKGLSWRFDSSDSECAITCFQMIPLKDRPSDFFAGTVVFPRGTVITEEQLQELQRKVSTAIEVLGRIVTKMRPDEMGPLEGKLRAIEDKERLERPHEICVIPQDSKFTLGGLVRKLVELHHNQLTVFIVEPQDGQATGHAELKAIEAVAQKSHPEAPVVVASDFDGLQLEDNRRYQELLDFRAEQKRIAEEKERAEQARKAEEERRRQEEERERQRRQAVLVEVFKKASKVLGALAVVAGLGYGGYMIKDEFIGAIQKAKNTISRSFEAKDDPPTIHAIEPIVVIQQNSTQDYTHTAIWSDTTVYLEQQFQFDDQFDPDSLVLIEESGFPNGVDLRVHEGNDSLHGLEIRIIPGSNSLGLIDTLFLTSTDLPGLPVSPLVVVLKKLEGSEMEGVAPEDDLEQESHLPAEDSTSVDTATTTADTP